MHILFEEIGALISTVPVEDSKVAAAGPSALEIGFGDVHDDGHPVFVIIFDQAVKGIDCVPLDCSIAALDEFDGLYARDRPLSLLLVLIHLFLTIISI